MAKRTLKPKTRGVLRAITDEAGLTTPKEAKRRAGRKVTAKRPAGRKKS